MINQSNKTMARHLSSKSYLAAAATRTWRLEPRRAKPQAGLAAAGVT